MKFFRYGPIMDFLTDVEAAVATEHAILLSLIAVTIFGAVTYFGSTVAHKLYDTSIAMLPF